MTITPLLGLCFAFPRLTKDWGFLCSSLGSKQSRRALTAPTGSHQLHSGSLSEGVNHFKQWGLAWLGRTHDEWVIHEFTQVVIYSLDLSWNIARGGVWSFQVKSWMTHFLGICLLALPLLPVPRARSRNQALLSSKTAELSLTPDQ